MSWFEVQLNAPELLREAVINRLFELGAQGVNEDDVLIRAFFEEQHRAEVAAELPPYLASLKQMHPGVPAVTMNIVSVESADWADRYKEFYVAQRLTHTFFLKPAWDKTTEVPEGMIPIVMDPGQAFGTGLHASTVLTLKLFESVLELYPSPSAVRLLDVGTGSGILAIAAEKLGVSEITAIDIDPVAVETAVENAELNGCKRVRFAAADSGKVKGSFQIVLSNILLEAHRSLVSEYRRLIVPGGQLILSGLLVHQHQELEDCFRGQGFTLEGSESSQEWMAFVFRRGEG